jgi:DNA processing protein
MIEQYTIIACALSLLPAPLQFYAAQEMRKGALLLDLLRDSTLKYSLEKRLQEAEKSLHVANQRDQKIVVIGAPEYPTPLLHLPIPPALLFVKGTLSFLSQEKEKIAIVGARSASVTDCLFVSNVAKEIAAEGVCVISGLALGVDGAAHRGALSSDRRQSTAAVLAHGLDTTYPRSHSELGERIIENGGALISEYTPGPAPLRHHFLARNRIIAALAHTTIVAQAGARSGSLVTAQVALELGREVCVLSNPTTQEVTEGSTKLIQDGALPLQTAQEILSLHRASPLTLERPTNTITPDSITEKSVVSLQHSSEKRPITLPLTDLLRVSKYSLSYLLDLELRGEITRLPGNQVTVPSHLFDHLSSHCPQKPPKDPQ